MPVIPDLAAIVAVDAAHRHSTTVIIRTQILSITVITVVRRRAAIVTVEPAVASVADPVAVTAVAAVAQAAVPEVGDNAWIDSQLFYLLLNCKLFR